jgi:hypothetical protein
LENPKFLTENLNFLNLQYCSNLKSVSFSISCFKSLKYLNLSGTQINDDCLNEIFKNAVNLTELECQDCEKLIKPNVVSKELKKLNFSFCGNLKTPLFDIPSCNVVKLRNTLIQDEILKSLLNQSVVKLDLSCCHALRRPIIKCEVVRELYFGCCSGIETFDFENELNCPNLRILDIQISNITLNPTKLPDVEVRI